jgi:hypothetical protein
VTTIKYDAIRIINESIQAVLPEKAVCKALACRRFGNYLASLVPEIEKGNQSVFLPKPSCAIIAGGETVVKIQGNGKGGRNQEVTLSAAPDTFIKFRLDIFSIFLE